MRILVVASYYQPDGGPAAPLYTMLCENLVRRGHEVTVISSVPHYPSGRVDARYRGMKIRRTQESGVRVVRVPLPSVNRLRLVPRLFQFLVFQAASCFAGLAQKYDVLLTHSPALEVWLPFAYYATVRRKPAVYSVHDIYPDVGVKLGIFRHKPVIGLVAALEKYCLHKASMLRVLSRSFIPRLGSLGVPDAKIDLIYDWVDVDAIKPLARDNPFAAQYNLVDKFVVLYAGNLGFVQGLDSVLDAADRLREHEKIRFVFVGDGGGKETMLAKSKKLKLPNVQFISYQPRECMPEVLAAADASLVALARGSGFEALPSKTYSILASGRPVIVSVDPGSDAWDLVDRSEAGLCIPPESPEELVGAILRLYHDSLLRESLGRHGREYVLRNHSPEHAAEAFERLLSRARQASSVTPT